MAEPWIKMRCSLAGDKAVIGIASALELDEHAVVGKLHCLWSWADNQSHNGHVPRVTEAWVDRHVRAEGFAAAMVAEKWLVFENGGVTFPKFNEHMSGWAKKRGLATKRQSRKRSRKSHTEGVTRSSSSSNTVSSSKGGVGGNAKRDFWEDAVRTMRGAALNTVDFRAAWEKWIEGRCDRKHTVSLRALNGHIRQCEEMGHDRAIAAMLYSDESNYQRLCEPSGAGQRQGARPASRKRTPADRGEYPEPGFAADG